MTNLVFIWPLIISCGQIASCGSNVPISSACGDWLPFKDESCVKLIERAGLQTKIDAQKVCREFAAELHQEDDVPELLTIKTKEKQDFVQKVLFNEHTTFDNVWLGLTIEKNGTVSWDDGTKLFYSNWGDQNTSDTNRLCVQMESGEGSYLSGQWVRVNCLKKNAIVCERSQMWSVTRLQNEILDMKLDSETKQKETERRFSIMTQQMNSMKQEAEAKIKAAKDEANKKLSAIQQELTKFKSEATQNIKVLTQELKAAKDSAETTRTQLTKDIQNRKQEVMQEFTHLKANPVPLGFVYVQLPGQQSPSTLWPQTQWKDISAAFAGNFFRVVGGNSAPFGEVQKGDSPRLTEAMTMWNKGLVYLATVPSDGTWSNAVHVSFYQGSVKDMYSLRFRLSETEVRPQNQAVKVWQRI